MADVKRTIGTSTGESSTIGAAITWGQSSSNYNRDSPDFDDRLLLEIVDAEEFLESNTLGSFTGTVDSTNYVFLYATDSVKHDGTYNTSKARLRWNSTGNPLYLEEDYIHIKWLAIYNDASAAGQEAMRIGSGAHAGGRIDTLVEKCVIRTNTQTAAIGVEYIINNATNSAYLFDCVFYMGGNLAGNPVSVRVASGTHAKTAYIEHCTMDGNGTLYGIRGGNSASTTTINIYNNACLDGTSDYFGDANTTYAGSANIASGNSLSSYAPDTENKYESVTLRSSDASGDQYLVTNLTGGSEDYQLLRGATGNDVAIHTADPGSTKDSRVDLTLDCAGNSRPSVYTNRCIGAFELTPAVVVTDVDGDESWTDQDTGLVITGEGFVY